jgi:hypothetical protein
MAWESLWHDKDADSDIPTALLRREMPNAYKKKGRFRHDADESAGMENCPYRRR